MEQMAKKEKIVFAPGEKPAINIQLRGDLPAIQQLEGTVILLHGRALHPCQAAFVVWKQIRRDVTRRVSAIRPRGDVAAGLWRHAGGVSRDGQQGQGQDKGQHFSHEEFSFHTFL